MISFIFAFLFNYIVMALVCITTTWIVLKIVKFEYPLKVAFQVSLLASLGAIFIGFGLILVMIVAFFLIKKYIRYDFKGMILVMVIWIIIFIPSFIVVRNIGQTLILKNILPPDAYEMFIRRH
ncbi:MAG: hypothetical protein PHD29_00025 [bacterium]|nr:hypothetical protein [bacterium]